MVLEAAAERGGEFVPYEGGRFFEEADRILNAWVFLVEARALSCADHDFLKFLLAILARLRQVDVFLPQDTERSHESAARCGKNVIPGLRGRGVGIIFERFGLRRLAALTLTDLVRPLNTNVRQLRKRGFSKHQSLIVTTTDQVPGHVCSHATHDRYRETNTITIRVEAPCIPLPTFRT